MRALALIAVIASGCLYEARPDEATQRRLEACFERCEESTRTDRGLEACQDRCFEVEDAI